MASQATVVPQANEIADEAGRPRIFVMLERLLLANTRRFAAAQHFSR
jgi:hypothetical protein